MKSQLVTAVVLALASAPVLAERPNYPYGEGIDGPAVRAALAARWPTDEPLRRNMEEIRAVVNATAAGMQGGRIAPASYVALGDAVDDRISRIAAESRLAPEADARLHALLARMFKAVDALRHGGDGPSNTALLRKALEDYAHAFDHPGLAQPERGTSVVSLIEARRLATTDVPGRVTRAHADIRHGEPLHYHVDVHAEDGRTARLNVDARSALVTMREPE